MYMKSSLKLHLYYKELYCYPIFVVVLVLRKNWYYLIEFGDTALLSLHILCSTELCSSPMARATNHGFCSYRTCNDYLGSLY